MHGYLVEEGHVDEAVVQHQGLPCTEQLSEQSSNVDSLVIGSSLTDRKKTVRIRCQRLLTKDTCNVKQEALLTLLLPLQYGIPEEYCLLKSKPCCTRNCTDCGSMTYSSEHSRVTLYTCTRYVSAACGRHKGANFRD